MKISDFKFLVVFAVLALLGSCDSPVPESEKADLIAYVDPFIGTDFHGHTYPGPVMPHGMIQVGPDTKLNGWDASSGYHYGDSIIYGFSHTHLSGTGIGDMGDFLLLPFTGDADEKPIAVFKKSDEQAKVGYYAVKFSNYNVEAELTSTTRVGLHRYSFGADENKRLLVDVGHILQATWGNSNLYNELEIIDNKTVRGLKHTRGWAKDHKVYFYAEFSSPFTVDQTVVDSVTVNESSIYKGENVYSYFSFNELAEDEQLLIRVSISSVDEKGAVKNMQAELTDWDFERVQKDLENAWKDELSRIVVTTDNQDDLTIFYTALYHTMIAPMTYQDVDGRYRGMDLEIHQLEPGKTNYTVFSLWDTFRAFHPLLTIVDEELSRDWVNNLLLKYEQGGLLPKWPLASNYTGTMVGYPAVSVIADALTKNIDGIDKELALEAAITSASYRPELVENSRSSGKRSLMPLYNKFVNEGRYIPADQIIKSVSYGLEMAYYDWCISEIARLVGQDETADYFRERSTYYKEYFDEGTGFMRGKNSDGSWTTPFNPKYSSHERADYVEGNAWQWTWFVPHDIDKFMDLFDSQKKFTQKLDTLFTTSSEILGEDSSGDITGLIGQYAHGNEPSHHVAYYYTYAGQAWKTQKIVDQILSEFYSSDPDGIIGNEDCGQMSAWYVLNSMGFYQIAPGNPVYTIGRPLFDRVEVPLKSGKTFTIITENNSKENLYVQEVYLNGEKHNSMFFNHDDIVNGSTLKLVMGKEPYRSIQAFNIDFNWGDGGPNAFAKPGLWADANPAEHVLWYKDMGVNTIQTFIVSCNGYAWYKNGVVPEQPGLKHDFLPEMVRLGHKEGMKVMGYLCIGSNTRWGLEYPDYSYGYPADRHIPYTVKYLEYLDELIRDAVENTGIDGFMIDWFYQPNRSSNNGKWLDCEKQRYEELMGEKFPGEEQLSTEDYDAYSRLAIAACWDVIYKATKESNPDCIIWLTSFDITHPHIVNSKMFQQIDWLMNEAGDMEGVEAVRNMVGEETRLITCLADWNNQDPKVVVPNAIKAGVGLYGFTKPGKSSLLLPIEEYLDAPVDSLQGDDKNIAVLARVYNGYSLDRTK